MTQGSLLHHCCVCGSSEATVNKQALNGLPRDVAVCDDCKQAVKLRQVGISRLKDGTVSVTDGRKGVCASTAA